MINKLDLRIVNEGRMQTSEGREPGAAVESKMSLMLMRKQFAEILWSLS